ncbi:MAG: GNAT family N-acetyltransferase [Fibrobacterota bacterium]
MFEPIDLQAHISSVRQLINSSFQTVMDDFNFTRKMLPGSPAFMDEYTLLRVAEKDNMAFFGYRENAELISCYALEMTEGDHTGLHRVCVRPDKRHSGIGTNLLHDSVKRASGLGKASIYITIIDENKRLKDWYLNFGYTVTEIKRFDNLPFTVCYMKFDIRF